MERAVFYRTTLTKVYLTLYEENNKVRKELKKCFVEYEAPISPLHPAWHVYKYQNWDWELVSSHYFKSMAMRKMRKIIYK